MHLTLRANERHHAIVRGDLKIRAQTRPAELVNGLDRRYNGHDLSRVHVVIEKVFMTRAENNLITAELSEMRCQNRKLVKEDRLYFSVLFSVNLEIKHQNLK
jgi:hypothetical protein